jgi:hypothetical protein
MSAARAALLLLVATAVPTLCACGSATAGGTAARGASVILSEHNKGRTVSVARGTRIVLRLHSTYWRIRGSSNPGVVRQTGAQRAHVVLPPKCLPGGGCGTVSVPFEARHAGRARLAATRTTCGEALRCSPAQGRYSVVIDVR